MANKVIAIFVKLQVFNFNNLVDISSKKFQILKKIEFSQEQWKRVFEYCSKSKIKIIVNSFDYESLNFVKLYSNSSGIKIPASDFCDDDFIEIASKNTDLLILGTGGSTNSEIEDVLTKLKKIFKKNCVNAWFSELSTKLENLDLQKITYFKNKFNEKIGFADHIDADFQKLAELFHVWQYLQVPNLLKNI